MYYTFQIIVGQNAPTSLKKQHKLPPPNAFLVARRTNGRTCTNGCGGIRTESSPEIFWKFLRTFAVFLVKFRTKSQNEIIKLGVSLRGFKRKANSYDSTFGVYILSASRLRFSTSPILISILFAATSLQRMEIGTLVVTRESQKYIKRFHGAIPTVRFTLNIFGRLNKSQAS